jgi:predicted nucleic acid-binding protein
VVDASVALKWLVPEEGSEPAERLAASATRLFAPRLIVGEVANALWKKVRRNLLSDHGARERLSALRHYFDLLLDDGDLVSPALALACQYDHPVYDFIYIEAARRHDAVLLTADDRLVRKLAGTAHGALLLRLSDWRPE